MRKVGEVREIAEGSDMDKATDHIHVTSLHSSWCFNITWHFAMKTMPYFIETIFHALIPLCATSWACMRWAWPSSHCPPHSSLSLTCACSSLLHPALLCIPSQPFLPLSCNETSASMSPAGGGSADVWNYLHLNVNTYRSLRVNKSHLAAPTCREQLVIQMRERNSILGAIRLL